MAKLNDRAKWIAIAVTIILAGVATVKSYVWLEADQKVIADKQVSQQTQMNRRFTNLKEEGCDPSEKNHDDMVVVKSDIKHIKEDMEEFSIEQKEMKRDMKDGFDKQEALQRDILKALAK